MTQIVSDVTCSGCGRKLPSERTSSNKTQVCPSCGSANQYVEMTITEEIGLYEQIFGKLKDPNLPSKKKTRVEWLTGSEWSKKLRKIVHKDRLIDRKNDRYKETVVAPDTKEVIHHCDEPLSQHTGHGSAKKPPRQ